MSKIIFLIFFSLKNKNLGAHLFVQITFLLKSGPTFDEAAKLGKVLKQNMIFSFFSVAY